LKGTAYLLRKLGAVAGVLIFALIFLSAFAASVRAAPLGITGYFGNLDGTAKVGGGFFSTTPRGVAVNDSSGDVYVADAGNNRLQRFDADGNFISAWGADVIPGGAAGTGNLTNGNNAITALVATNKAFVVGQTITGAGIPAGTTITGITAGPSSESKLTLSNSAEATVPGAIINVAEGAGNVAQNEQQVLTLTATGGNFKLTVQKSQGFGIETTANIPFNAAAAAVQSSLEALPAIGVGNVSVSSSNPGGGAEPGGPYVIEFKGKLADVNVPQMGTGTAGSPPLTGGSASVATSVQGGTAYEVCAIAAQCKSGVAIGSNGELGAPGGTLSAPQGIAISQASGDLYVTNQALQRVEQLSSSGAFVRAWGWDVVRSGKAGDKPPASAVQTLIVSATGGKYELEFQGQKTSGLLAGPSGTASEVQTALQLLPLIGSGNATVSGPAGGPYAITFAGALANNPEPDIVVSSSSSEPLIGGSATAGTTTPGSTGFEICSIAADCQKGRSEGGPGGAFTAGFASTVGYPAVASAGAPNAGNVLVPEVFGKRVREFSASGAVVRSFGAGVTAAGPGNTGSGFEICRAADSDVCAFGAAGAGAGEFATGGPTRLAVDTAGNIFTAEPVGNFRIQKFAPSGGSLTPTVFNPQIHSLSGEAPTAEFPLTGSSSADAPTDIAVDPTDNHLYVAKACTAPHCPGAANPAERRLYDFDTATGALVETHLAGYNVPAINGLGLRAGGEAAYLSSSTPKAGVYIAGPPTPPHATIETPTGLNAECATFHGAVNPEGGGPLGLLHTSYRFEYRPTGSSGPWGKIPASDIDLGAGGAPVAVEQTACGLQPNRQYGVKLVAIKGGSPVTAGPITFTTDPAGPSPRPSRLSSTPTPKNWSCVARSTPTTPPPPTTSNMGPRPAPRAPAPQSLFPKTPPRAPAGNRSRSPSASPASNPKPPTTSASSPTTASALRWSAPKRNSRRRQTSPAPTVSCARAPPPPCPNAAPMSGFPTATAGGRGSTALSARSPTAATALSFRPRPSVSRRACLGHPLPIRRSARPQVGRSARCCRRARSPMAATPAPALCPRGIWRARSGRNRPSGSGCGEKSPGVCSSWVVVPSRPIRRWCRWSESAGTGVTSTPCWEPPAITRLSSSTTQG